MSAYRIEFFQNWQLYTYGFSQTAKEIAMELGILENDVKAAMDKLKEAGRIIITEIPRKTTIEFRD